ncbi:MAG: hypothetical protein QOJ46_233 [bacterium]|jgi:hypothetical protein
MAFESKRLRVQLPCGDTTVVQKAAVQPTPPIHQTFNCTPTVCGFVTPTVCQWPSAQTCWCSFHTPPVTVTCAFGTCGNTIPHCGITPNCGGTPNCIGSGDPIGPVEIDAEHLTVLREQLESQLADIDAAQKAVEEHQGGQ